MANYFYKCKNGDKIEEGFIGALNAAEASSKLEGQGFVVLELKEQIAPKTNAYLNYEISDLNIREKKEFFTSLYEQYKSGISFFEIFNNIMVTASTNNLRTLSFNISKRLQKGKEFEDVIKQNSKYIGDIEASLIIAGHKSGKIIEVLGRIAEQIKNKEKNIATAKSKMLYPASLFVLLYFAILIFVFFIFPAFNMAIEKADFSLDCAYITKAILKIIATFVLTVLVVFWVIKNKNIKHEAIRVALNFKATNLVLKNYYFSNFFATFSLSQDAGLLLSESLNLANKVIKSTGVNQRIEKAQSMVQEGCELTTALNVANVFEEYAISQIATGEKTGQLHEVLNDLAKDYENRYNASLDALLKLLETILLIVCAIVILVVGAGLYAAIYKTLFGMF